MAKFSCVVLLENVDTFVVDVLETLNLSVIAAESDVPLGYFTVQGTNENITMLKQYLAGAAYI